MQKSLSEIVSLPEEEVVELITDRAEPLLITHHGEPRFIAQSLEAYEGIVRRLRELETEGKKPEPLKTVNNVIPFRR